MDLFLVDPLMKVIVAFFLYKECIILEAGLSIGVSQIIAQQMCACSYPAFEKPCYEKGSIHCPLIINSPHAILSAPSCLGAETCQNAPKRFRPSGWYDKRLLH
jgi:hypothetical protein